ncbi:unnamed protein product [Didymodactylos carnosus]|uniref:Poly [ADP-ribose] polymerase n=1 Tax=Didymodactylos carnosus TaxID=1234261 RepID=A0A814XKK7_9BILA|nr:unnamed protein product [Didymodactylos carnosus]CAF3981028.1 unnamed protein product [Didymodactylos carnosus]
MPQYSVKSTSAAAPPTPESQERLNENAVQWLFHGCVVAAQSIQDECFNRSYGRRQGKLLSAGTYFTRNAASSHAYATTDREALHRICLVRVLIGNWHIIITRNMAGLFGNIGAAFVDNAADRLVDNFIPGNGYFNSVATTGVNQYLNNEINSNFFPGALGGGYGGYGSGFGYGGGYGGYGGDYESICKGH